MVQVKVCGIRRVVEAESALAGGASFLGFVFYPPSHRNLSPLQARDLLRDIRAAARCNGWAAVGVFVNEPPGTVNEIADLCGLDFVQLHGTESPEYCAQIHRPVIKALRLHELADGPVTAARFGATRLLLDAPGPGSRGGMGETIDWSAARPHAAEALVAGGLTPDNVTDALDVLRPWGIDVSSGVERDRTKDPQLIETFLARVRQWERLTDGN